jgi:hypothetical protein
MVRRETEEGRRRRETEGEGQYIEYRREGGER